MLFKILAIQKSGDLNKIALEWVTIMHSLSEYRPLSWGNGWDLRWNGLEVWGERWGLGRGRSEQSEDLLQSHFLGSDDQAKVYSR